MRARYAFLGAVMLVAAGCSGGDDSSPASTAPQSTSSPATTAAAPQTQAPTTSTATTIAPTTTAAPATTTVDLPALFQDLINRHDKAVTDVLADPTVATDPASPKIVAFLSLFPKDSTFAAGSLKFWADEAAKGRAYRPNKVTTLSTSTVQEVTASSATEATFTVCSVNSYSVIDTSGNVIEADAGVTGGKVVAVNVEGRWLLRDLTQAPGDKCPKPGATG